VHRRLNRNTPASRLAANGTGTKGVLNLRQLSQRKRTSIQERRSFVPALIPVGAAKSIVNLGAVHLQTKDDTSDKMVADPHGAASRISRCSPRSNQKAPNS
jgi:hypothetical protein